jgi:DNA invertase Pin-like site-specific DNA recombinase
MSERHDISADDLRLRTVAALDKEWQRWAAALPSEAGAWPKGAAYIRESSPDSLVGDAPVVQLQNTLAMLEAQRVHVPQDHVFFENASGTEIAARHEFQDLIERAAAGEFGVIGAYMSNRLFRNMEEAIAVKRRMRLLGIRVIWVGKPMMDERDPASWAMERNMEIADEWHSRQTGYLVGRAMEYKTRKGEPLGRLPECWRIIERAPGLRAGRQGRPIKWELAEPMASIVRKGARKYLRGSTYRQLGEWSLTTAVAGITPAGKHMDWLWWRNILVNPKIAGYQAASSYTGYKPGKESPSRPSLKEREDDLVPCLLPPLISLAEFRKIVATSRARKGARKVRITYHDEIISTIAYDARCGHRLHIKGRSKNDRADFVLRCKEMTAAGYHMSTYRGLDAQLDVDRLIGQICLDDPELLRRVAAELMALENESDDTPAAKTGNDPRAVELRAAAASLTDERFASLRSQLLEELAEIERETKPAAIESVARFHASIEDLKRWPEIWAKADKRQKNELLRAAGVKVWIEPVATPNTGNKKRPRPYSRLVAIEAEVPEFSLALATALRGASFAKGPAIALNAPKKQVGILLLNRGLATALGRAQRAVSGAAHVDDRERAA